MKKRSVHDRKLSSELKRQNCERKDEGDSELKQAQLERELAKKERQ